MTAAKLAMAGALAALALAPMPAWAAFCPHEGPTVPLTFDDQNGGGELVVDREAQELQDKQRLREVGVLASAVERWNGCMQAFVELPDGTRGMQFFDPLTLRQVQ